MSNEERRGPVPGGDSPAGAAGREVRAMAKRRYGSVAAFARAIGVRQTTLYSAMKSGFRNATLCTAEAVARGLDLDLAELAHDRLAHASPAGGAAGVPLRDFAPAGEASQARPPAEAVPVPPSLLAANPDAFAMRVRGAAMDEVMPDGFIAVVAPCGAARRTGALYAVSVAGSQPCIRRVVLYENGLALEPMSSDPTVHALRVDYADEHAPDVRVVGRVVWFCPPPDWACPAR